MESAAASNPFLSSGGQVFVDASPEGHCPAMHDYEQASAVGVCMNPESDNGQVGQSISLLVQSLNQLRLSGFFVIRGGSPEPMSLPAAVAPRLPTRATELFDMGFSSRCTVLSLPV